jgi:hypothetical protein
MSLMDALFYWLQMKWVSSARPDDEAAKETLLFFAQILSEDHELTSFVVSAIEPAKVFVTYSVQDGTTRTVWFDRETVEQLNRDMFGVQDDAAGADDDDDEEETH